MRNRWGSAFQIRATSLADREPWSLSAVFLVTKTSGDGQGSGESARCQGGKTGGSSLHNALTRVLPQNRARFRKRPHVQIRRRNPALILEIIRVSKTQTSPENKEILRTL